MALAARVMDYNIGVSIGGNGSDISSVDGDIVITGNAGSDSTNSSQNNYGIRTELNALIRSTGTGSNAATITLNGTAGAGYILNHGVLMTGSSVLSSVDGDIAVTGNSASNGNAGNNFNDGIVLETNSQVLSTGSTVDAASITLTGTGPANADNAGFGVLGRRQHGAKPMRAISY